LSERDVQQFHHALLAFRLATYEYKHEGPAAPPHLGFIIDDVGRSPAADPNGATVDLYGFTSMAVAAIQAQARQIAQLEREVAMLRGCGQGCALADS